MSAPAVHISPLLESALAVVSRLSRDEKTALVEQVEAELAQAETVPAWHLEILEERTRFAAEGQDDSLPAEAAFQEIRAAFQRERSHQS